ncbi:MAG: phosphatase PAP2 family protein [Bacteroidales bacterium]|nr:phosphatase PAP2 family protein [Candidatus Cryptobacteroides equifaecalis]
MEILKYLHHLDKEITLAINSLHCTPSDYVWQLFSNKYIWFVFYFIVLIFLFRNLGWKKGLLAVVAIALTITACDQFANFTKAYFERLRPCWDEEMVRRGLHILEGKGNLYGFYSAHAANAMGFAVSSYRMFKQDTNKLREYTLYAKIVFPWAFLVGISRVFVGKHFFGDVMVGFAVGALFAYIITAIACKLIRKR